MILDKNRKLIGIENNSSYKLDPLSGAYVNVDKSALLERKYKRKLQQKIDSMQEEINTLKQEVAHLKNQSMSK
jgi:uncharacterized protein YlxW (UPF0749 family)